MNSSKHSTPTKGSIMKTVIESFSKNKGSILVVKYSDGSTEERVIKGSSKGAEEQKIDLETMVYEALQANVEGGGMVYIDNAYTSVKDVMSRHQFSGYLSSLAKKGKYRDCQDEGYKGYFGEVI